MPIIRDTSAPRFSIPGIDITGLAAPSRGSREVSAWRLTVAPHTPGTLHTVDREEIFIALRGRAVATLDGFEQELAPGDAMVVPAGQPFALANPHAEPFEAVAAMPAGGKAAMPGGAPFVPPWCA